MLSCPRASIITVFGDDHGVINRIVGQMIRYDIVNISLASARSRRSMSPLHVHSLNFQICIIGTKTTKKWKCNMKTIFILNYLPKFSLFTSSLHVSLPVYFPLFVLPAPCRAPICRLSLVKYSSFISMPTLFKALDLMPLTAPKSSSSPARSQGGGSIL